MLDSKQTKIIRDRRQPAPATRVFCYEVNSTIHGTRGKVYTDDLNDIEGDIAVVEYALVSVGTTRTVYTPESGV